MSEVFHVATRIHERYLRSVHTMCKFLDENHELKYRIESFEAIMTVEPNSKCLHKTVNFHLLTKYMETLFLPVHRETHFAFAIGYDQLLWILCAVKGKCSGYILSPAGFNELLINVPAKRSFFFNRKSTSVRGTKLSYICTHDSKDFMISNYF